MNRFLTERHDGTFDPQKPAHAPAASPEAQSSPPVWIEALGVLALLGFTSGSPSWLGAAETPSPNAALTYWQAFATMPRLNDHKTGKRVFEASYDEGIVKPIDEELAKYLQMWASRTAIRLLHRAAGISHCDWGLNLSEDGLEVRLGHVDKARPMMRLCLARARYHFEEGRDREGVDDVIATMAMGRHLASDGLTASLFAGYNLEHMACYIAAAYLPRMSPEGLDYLGKRLDALPPFPSLGEVLANERWHLDWLVEKYQAADEKRRRELCRLLTDSDEAAGTLYGADVLKLAADLRPLYEEIDALASLPPEKLRKAVEKRIAPKVDGNPLGQVMFPDLVTTRTGDVFHQCRRALLRAAIDVVRRGTDALEDHPDPHGDGPFEREAFDGGFELRSQLEYLKYRKVPTKLTLRVGIRKP
jgi:hypothetical protein